MAFVADGAQIAALLRSEQGHVMRGLAVRAQRVQERARQLVGVRTGTLKSSIVKRFAQDPAGPSIQIGVFSGPALAYARFHHEGTAPHPIEGNPLLVFFWPKVGRVVFFRHVNHPGTKPNRYLTDALPAGGGS